MINLAGREDCDDFIRKELEEADIEYVSLQALIRRSEVPSAILGDAYGWTFRRAWYYYVATAQEGTAIPLDIAETFHEQWGKEVRVSGHCGCPSPREWYDKPWQTGVPLYHIDTQAGLNAFAGLIRELATEEDKT